MTQVHFYHNAANPLGLTCELVARAFSGGRRVAIRTPESAGTKQLDDALWTFEHGSFIPHVLVGSPLEQETPVVLGHAEPVAGWPHQDLLFNLSPEVPTGFEDFRMVVEIVSQNEEDRLKARSRWMRYKSLGADLKAFDAVRRERM